MAGIVKNDDKWRSKVCLRDWILKTPRADNKFERFNDLTVVKHSSEKLSFYLTSSRTMQNILSKSMKAGNIIIH